MKIKLYVFDKESMLYKRFRIWPIAAISIFGLAGYGYGAIMGAMETQTVTLEQEKLIILLNESEKQSFKPTQVLDMLRDINVKFPHIVYAQAILESGNFQSDVFRTNNNMFGMKQPSKRVTLSKGVIGNYASYDSWKDCVLDYAYYQSTYLSDLKTEDQYYNYLQHNYAQDTTYAELVRNIANKYKK